MHASIQVRLFARARQLARASVLDVEAAPGMRIADLRRALASRHPDLASLLERSALAVDNEFANDDLVIPDRADIALIPPVSGG